MMQRDRDYYEDGIAYWKYALKEYQDYIIKHNDLGITLLDMFKKAIKLAEDNIKYYEECLNKCENCNGTRFIKFLWFKFKCGICSGVGRIL
jgi:tetratricopeptide (TPR) repeat protein